MIGAQADEELHRAVAEWRIREDGRTGSMPSVSDFILQACLEKLEHAGIKVDRRAVLMDGRTARLIYPSRTAPAVHLNEVSSTAPAPEPGAGLASDVTKAALTKLGPRPEADAPSGKASPPGHGAQKRRGRRR